VPCYGDFDFADIRNYPPEAWHGIVVLVAPPRATARTFRALMSALLESDVVSRLPGRVAVSIRSSTGRCHPRRSHEPGSAMEVHDRDDGRALLLIDNEEDSEGEPTQHRTADALGDDGKAER